jgi:hypothetical protein
VTAPTKIGKYEIRRQIGRGAMGTVSDLASVSSLAVPARREATAATVPAAAVDSWKNPKFSAERYCPRSPAAPATGTQSVFYRPR